MVRLADGQVSIVRGDNIKDTSPLKVYLTMGIVLILVLTIINPMTFGYKVESFNQRDIFILNGDNDTTPPVTNISLKGNMSEFGFFSSDVEVTLNATDDLSGVNVTYYELDDNNKEIYHEPFIVTEHAWHVVKYYSVDNAGNVEDWKYVDIIIDLKTPYINIAWRRLQNKSIEFSSDEDDDGTGNYKVEYYIDNEYMHTSYKKNNDFVWYWNPPISGKYVASAIIYDKAENTGRDDGVIVIVPRTRASSYWFLERFPMLERLLGWIR